MPKAKVLGHDPLAWIKSTRSSADEGGSSPSPEAPPVASSQPPPSEETPRAEAIHEQAETVQTAATVVEASVAVAEPNEEGAAAAEQPETVHEGVSSEPEAITQPARTFEIRSVAEYLNEKFARINGQEEQVTGAPAEAHPQGLFGAVLVVIAVLLVALGYIAYSDAMGRIERLNKKVRQIEQQMPVPPGHEVNF